LSEVDAKLKAGKINNVAPGVFFYWISVTSGSTFTITETSTPTFHPFLIASGSFAYDANCNVIKRASITQDVTTGTVTITGTGIATIGIKYSATSVKGFASPPTTYVYDFATTQVAGSDQTLNLVVK
jgi:hypothetical protein